MPKQKKKCTQTHTPPRSHAPPNDTIKPCVLQKWQYPCNGTTLFKAISRRETGTEA